MTTATFEFRVCRNPECGLRYPALAGNAAARRCPACLGRTEVAASRRVQREEEQDATARSTGLKLAGLLDNIRSALNAGSMFRTAEGYGFRHLYLCGITPTPENAALRKTALGADRLVTWSHHQDAVELIAGLKRNGNCIWALERTESSISIEEAMAETAADAPHVLVAGNEQAGVDPGVIAMADRVVHLEMRGRKRSFNVAVAFAIAAHEMRRNTGR